MQKQQYNNNKRKEETNKQKKSKRLYNIPVCAKVKMCSTVVEHYSKNFTLNQATWNAKQDFYKWIIR